MKNNLLGLSLITAGCIIIYVFAGFAPVTAKINTPDFLRGFFLGIGVVTASYLTVLLIRRAMEKKQTT